MEPRASLNLPIGPEGEWTIEMTWYEGDRNGPGRMLIRATDPVVNPPSGLSQTVLRDIDFGAAIALIRETETVAGSVPKIDWDTIGPELADLSARGITDEYLARLSLAYSAASSAPKPLEYLGKLTGKSTSAIKSHLWQATRKGFLERSPGRAGGRITLGAITVLNSGVTNLTSNDNDEPLAQ